MIRILTSDPTYEEVTGLPDTVTISKEGDYDYKITGDFSAVENIAHFGQVSFKKDYTTIECIIYEQTSSYLKVYTPINQNINEYDLYKIYKSTGHAIDCWTYVKDEIDGIIPRDNAFVIKEKEGLTNLTTQHNFKVVTRSTTGLGNAFNESPEIEAQNNAGVGWVHAHGGNTHTNPNEPMVVNLTRLDIVSAVGAGDNDGNKCSYNDGLEYYLNCESYGCPALESWSTPIVGGMIAKLLANHPAWNFHDARQALRQTASNWDTGWSIELTMGDTRDKGGFGAVDYEQANALTTDELLCMSPMRTQITKNADNIQFQWKNPTANQYSETVVAIYTTEPNRNTTPTESQIIYQGTDESYTYENYGDIGTVWFVFHTLDSNGNYSKIESYDKEEVATNPSFTVQGQLINSGNKSSLVSSILL